MLEADLIRSIVESVRNLSPKAFALATDHEANIKQRWTAFDELYEAVRQGFLDKGLDPDEALSTDGARAGDTPVPGGAPVTEAMADSSRRRGVALALMLCKYGWDKQALNEAAFQCEELVPAQPDPETGRPPLTLKDNALLNSLTNLMRTAMKEDWEAFFRQDSVPAPRRKLAFRRMYAVIGEGWQEHSLFARSLSPEDRQKIVILALMCHVPKEQWGDEDIKELHADLLPIEEPDWNDTTLFPPRP